VNYAAFSPNGKQIVTASDDYTARAWLTNGDKLFTMEGHTDSVKSAVYSPGGGTILTAGFDGMARLWDSSSGRFLLAIDVSTEGQKELNFAAFSPAGNASPLSVSAPKLSFGIYMAGKSEVSDVFGDG
jgi:WD40 repeat protein